MVNIKSYVKVKNDVKIIAGIVAGLEDAKAGRSQEITDDYVIRLKQRLQERLNKKKG